MGESILAQPQLRHEQGGPNSRGEQPDESSLNQMTVALGGKQIRTHASEQDEHEQHEGSNENAVAVERDDCAHCGRE